MPQRASERPIRAEETNARLSTDTLYRYELSRWWGPGDGVLWVMLNPSTADATVDDPTIRRCRGFSQAWGFGGLVVVNLYALRCTRPVHLLDHPDPVGPDNERTIKVWLEARNLPLVVCAWGDGARRLSELVADQAGGVLEWAAEAGRTLRCLGTTREGEPRHPLYLPADTPLQAYGG